MSDIDLGHMAITLAAKAVGYYGHLQNGLERAVKLGDKTARSLIGKYQPAIGPHPEWPELAESTKEQRVRQGYSEDEPLLRRGDLRDSFDHEVHGLEGVWGSKSDIMPFQEFGTSTIPARPVVGPSEYLIRDEVKKILGHAAMMGIANGSPIHAALGYDVTTDPDA